MKIKDVEKRTGITSYNIRFYEKENLLIPKRNPVNGYREYTEEDILLLNRIKMLRMLDIPVSDIRKILYEKEALTSVLNTHLLKIKEEENRLRQNYFLCEELIKMDMSVTDLSEEMLDKMVSGKEEYIYQLERIKRQDRIQSLQDFGFIGDEETEEPQAEAGLMPEEDPKPVRGGGASSSATAYRDINRKLGSFYEEPKVDGEKEELKRQVEELTAKLEERERQAGGIDDQVALMEKSYELAAKYMGQNGQDGATVQAPATGQGGNGLGQPAVAVQAARERTVSGLQQPLSDAEFMRRYSQPRNYGFNTAVGSGYALGKNTIAACIHQDQTVMDGQQVKLRLLEPLQAGNLIIPRNTVVSGTGKVQGERLDITVSSVQYQGNILPVELAVYDNEGMKGLCIETSLEREAAKEAMANIGGGLGTSISFARSAGQQVAMDITRGLMQGGSQYLAKKFRTVKVHLKAGDPLMLYAKQQ